MFVTPISMIKPIEPTKPVNRIPVFKVTQLQKDTFQYTQPTFQPSFTGGGRWPKPDLKQLWDKGQLPKVVKGFYGDILTPENISREHLKPASKGGKKFVTNIVLASKQKNNARGNRDIRRYCDPQLAKEYLEQFTDIKIKGFSGKEYIKQIKITLKRLGVEL